MKIFGPVLRLTLSGLFALAAIPAQTSAALPDQEWYPQGYLDLKIAAAAQVVTFPGHPNLAPFTDPEDPRTLAYDVIDCDLGSDLPDMELYDRQLAALALDIARMRFELQDLGYKRATYDQPLLDYERAALEDLKARISDPAANSQDDRTDQTDGAEVTDPGPESWTPWNFDRLEELAVAMEARRGRADRTRPRIVFEGGCGAGESEFTIKLVPASGELWLINAFAFRVCERKVSDPWEHGACGWTQFVEGDSTFASGRYMYEARWGGAVKRGARVMEGDPTGEEIPLITFSR